MTGVARGRVVQSRTRVAAALVTGALLLAAVLPAPAAAAAPNQEANAEPVRVIVRFKAPPGRDERASIAAAGGRIHRTFHVVPAIAASVPERALAGLRRNPLVESIELDGKLTLFDHPSESAGVEYDNAWGVEHIGSDDVHATGNRGAGIKVAVIDSGIDYTHEELDGPYVGGEDFVLGPDQLPILDGDPFDDNGHGTHVSGILAAELNGWLVVGGAPGAEIIALKVVDANGEGEYSSLVAALEWILDYNAANADDIDLVNMSLGGSEVSATLEAAVEATYAGGVALVAASGNINLADPNEIINGCPVKYPAAYPEVLATTFTAENDDLTGYSCTGPEVDFAAPGDNVPSTVPRGSCMFCSPDGYQFLSGTSMASPHLAASVALVLANGIANAGDPATLADDVKTHLCATTNPGTHFPPTDPRYPKWFGCGVVDVENALVLSPPPPPGPVNTRPVANDDAATTAEDTAVAINVLANDTDADGDPLTAAVGTAPAHGSAAVQGGAIVYTPAANYAGPDSFTYTASDGRGGTDPATVSVTVTPVNDPPTVAPDSASVAEDGSLVVAVLANDGDVDGDTLAVSSVGSPAHGTAAANADGTVTYTPAANYAGPDSFGYTATDGLASAASTVTITVTAVNDAPAATGGSVATAVDTSVTLTLAGADVETCELTFTVVSGPINGTLGSPMGAACTAGSPNGDTATALYTPNLGFVGNDQVIFRSNDDSLDSPTATIAISVTGSPPPPPPGPTVHVGDLDQTAAVQTRNWTAKVTIRAETGSHAARSGATVTGTWGGGASGTGTCTTGSNGRCTVKVTKLPLSLASVTFSVTNVSYTGSTYVPGANHDPDAPPQNSNGTTITVVRT